MNTPPNVCRFSHAKMVGVRVTKSMIARDSGSLPGNAPAPG